MARRVATGEPRWPAWLREYDPGEWESEFEWKVARVKWARAQGYRNFRVLPLIREMVADATGGG